ncbi:hypothetical protein FQR65_LT10725 [Abscondita terminalis]|nr:hypothetical protein FQR65_LT10725 [Abscondita terminalis]
MQIQILTKAVPKNINREPVKRNMINEVVLVENEKNDAPVKSENNDFYRLMEMFPDACPQYLKKICVERKRRSGLNILISEILESDYPKREKRESIPTALSASEQLEILKNILVDADPDYLQMQCEMLIDEPNKLKEFIEKAVVERNYPTLDDFLRKQQLSAQQKQYTSEFTVEKFLEEIPNPKAYFKNSNIKNDNMDCDYILSYLRNKFNNLPLRTIKEILVKNEYKFLKSCSMLEQIPATQQMKCKRRLSIMPEVSESIPLLQEIAYYEHKKEILAYMKKRKSHEEIEKAQTKQAGLMKTCSCCFDDEVMPKNIFCCENGCSFCKFCIAKGVEVAFGEGKVDFACLTNCSAYFSFQVLQAVLKPKVFSTITLKKQVQEVKAAGIEDLETCPFCDFVTIPDRQDKLFRCLNPTCMKESCRQCKEPSHVPLRCDEIEKDNEVKNRTYIENKMTEALLRTCYKCSTKFVKEDGCNKMTCPCGALMCYICGQPVKDYTHFNGLGGSNTELCPLYSDTNELHKNAVLEGARKAKNEIGVTDSQLKIRPYFRYRKALQI